MKRSRHKQAKRNNQSGDLLEAHFSALPPVFTREGQKAREAILTNPPDLCDLLAAYFDAQPIAFEIDCVKAREAITAGADPEQYRRAFDLWARTGNAALFRGLEGVKVTDETP